MKVPKISAPELMEYAKELFPSAEVSYSPINPEYNSWRIHIKNGPNLFLDISWGPLSGFGSTDVINRQPDEDNPFDPYEIGFDSLHAAKKWMKSKNG